MTSKAVAAFNCSTVREALKHPPLVSAKAALLAKHPFFASLLLDMMEIRLCDEIPTLATDGKAILVNTQFFDNLEVPYQIAALCHEIGHAMWLHMIRAKQYETSGLGGYPFSPQLWNIAGDYIINRLLSEAGTGKIHPNWLYDEKYTLDMSTVDVYLDLLKQYPPQGAGSGRPGQGSGSGGSLPQTQDDHLRPEGYSAQADEKSWQHATKAAAGRAKAVGKLPGALQQFVDSFTESVVDWREQLRMSMTRTFTSDSTTWRRPNRRRLWIPGIYMPSRSGMGAGQVWVWMDTSGSIAQAEYEAYFGELHEILSTCTPSELFLGFCDARVNDVYKLEDVGELHERAKKIPGGGGTDFRPPWEHMLSVGAQPDVVVYLTDMYGPFPDESPWDTIWVATSDVEAPFGKTIRLNLS